MTFTNPIQLAFTFSISRNWKFTKRQLIPKQKEPFDGIFFIFCICTYCASELPASGCHFQTAYFHISSIRYWLLRRKCIMSIAIHWRWVDAVCFHCQSARNTSHNLIERRARRARHQMLFKIYRIDTRKFMVLCRAQISFIFSLFVLFGVLFHLTQMQINKTNCGVFSFIIVCSLWIRWNFNDEIEDTSRWHARIWAKTRNHWHRIVFGQHVTSREYAAPSSLFILQQTKNAKWRDAVGDATLQNRRLCTEMSPALFWAFFFFSLSSFSANGLTWTASLTRHDTMATYAKQFSVSRLFFSFQFFAISWTCFYWFIFICFGEYSILIAAVCKLCHFFVNFFCALSLRWNRSNLSAPLDDFYHS